MKRTIKKLFMSILVVVMLCANISVYAAVSPAKTTAYAGQVVTLTYTYKGIAGINGTFTYSNPGIFSDINFSIDGLSSGKYNEKTKSLAYFNASPVDCTITLKLTVAKGAKIGEACDISLQYETTADGNLPSVPDYKYDKSTVTVVEKLEKSALQSLIKQAEGLKKGDYLTNTWTPLETALKSAKSVLNGATTQKEINAAVQSLQDAISKLEKKPDYTALEKQIKIAEALKKEDYTVKTWDALAKALDNAKKAKSTTKQSEINKAMSELKTAIANLVSIYEGKLDYTELNAQLKIADGLKTNDYAKKGWSEFLTAYQNAKKAKTSKLQYEIDTAADELKAAIAALEKIDYSALSAILKEFNDYIENNQFLNKWNDSKHLLDEANAALSSRNQQTVDGYTKQLKDLLLALKKAIADMAGVDSVTVEKEVVVEPDYDYCNIESHPVWIVLFWISFAINIALGGLIGFYCYTKRKKTTDNTPLVDYDISDDE